MARLRIRNQESIPTSRDAKNAESRIKKSKNGITLLFLSSPHDLSGDLEINVWMCSKTK
ncbi:MAG: hypothetical protein LWX07_11475 [Bacteroidetes bacterium]|nr:hypothetical protein [Bacteroidota bacterium]